MIRDFDIKLLKLPASIQKIILSDFQRIISFEIGKIYNLSGSKISLINNLVYNIYFGEEKIYNLLPTIQHITGVDGETAKKVTADIIGKKLLIAKSFFSEKGEDIVSSLQVLGSNESIYSKDVEIAQQALKEEENSTYDHYIYLYRNQAEKSVIKKMDSSEDNSESEPNLEDRFLALKGFFENNLLLTLAADTSPTLEEINESLILVLGDKPELNLEIEKIIEENKAIIGAQIVLAENQQVPPTVSNWIKDFNKINGTRNFDALEIAHYFIESKNARALSEKDRLMLRRLLLLYRNIKYFHEIFSNQPVEQWTIIPTVRPEQEIKFLETELIIPKQNSTQKSTTPVIKPQPVITPIKTKTIIKPSNLKPVSKPVTPIVKNEAKMATTNNPTITKIKAISEKPSDELLALKNMLLQYPPNSLERQAIEDEIRKLEQDSK